MSTDMKSYSLPVKTSSNLVPYTIFLKKERKEGFYRVRGKYR